MKRSPRLAPFLLFLFVQTLSSLVLRAQVERTALTGTVTDQQGNRIPQSRVRATEGATGFERETLTTSQGTYELSGLPPGLYSVQFLKSGLADLTVEGVKQVVGQTRTLDAQLELAHGKDETTVTEPLVQLDKVDATMGVAIELAQVDDLPINGRNWATLTALAPGAINNGAGDQRTIRFAGHGLDDNNLTLDGIDATAVYNQEQREYMRLNIPLDSIEEFQVQSQNFGADSQSGPAGKCPWFPRRGRTICMRRSSIISGITRSMRARRSTGLLLPLFAEPVRRRARRAHRTRQDFLPR
jgi:hypothetical protein